MYPSFHLLINFVLTIYHYPSGILQLIQQKKINFKETDIRRKKKYILNWNQLLTFTKLMCILLN